MNKIKQIFRAMLWLLVILICFLFMDHLLFEAEAQQPKSYPVVVDYRAEPTDSARLVAEFGQHKQLPEGYELQALLALSHYPELRHAKVSFRQGDYLIPLASRPTLGSIFIPFKKMHYVVYISTGGMKVTEPILLKNLPHNAQIGVLGHELAHTADYLGKSKLQMLGIGFRYFSGKFRKQFERATDQRAMSTGSAFRCWNGATSPARQWAGKWAMWAIRTTLPKK